MDFKVVKTIIILNNVKVKFNFIKVRGYRELGRNAVEFDKLRCVAKKMNQRQMCIRHLAGAVSQLNLI